MVQTQNKAPMATARDKKRPNDNQKTDATGNLRVNNHSKI
jgi:hypothetical protein